mmetsp:Transcript_14767/g.40787  ORF Transcript_14767/g.40787 Transcript_14767/m.40787 type:complete len:204 (-) Transcript_14767:334-945(-)
MPRQPAAGQISNGSVPIPIDTMATCQKPCSGCTTGTHLRGDARRAALCPPKAISARLSWSPGGTKIAKWGGSPVLAHNRPKKLYSPFTERPSRPKPTMPSKGACRNGSAVMFVAATKMSSAQASALDPLLRSMPRQTMSRTKFPWTMPGSTSWLSRPIVTMSMRPRRIGKPSAFTLTAPGRSGEYWRCRKQAGAEQRVESRMT